MDWDGKRPEGRKIRGMTNLWGPLKPRVAMMQSTDFGNRDDRAEFRRFDWPSAEGILVERGVSAQVSGVIG